MSNRCTRTFVHALLRAAWLCLVFLPSALSAEGLVVVAEIEKLFDRTTQVRNNFGKALSLDGDSLAIVNESDPKLGGTEGAVLIFDRVDGTWVGVDKLLDAPANRLDLAVSLDGDRLAIGASRDNDQAYDAGAVFVYERDAEGQWVATEKLFATDPVADGVFGHSISLRGERLAVGAFDSGPTRAGAVDVFELGPDGSWLTAGHLLADDGSEFDEFGSSVSIDGDRLAIGARGVGDRGESSGAVYLFERGPDGVWVTVQKIVLEEPTEADFFGESVRLDGDRLVVGVPRDDDVGLDSGAVYVFEETSDGVWTEVEKILTPEGSDFDNFGESVSLEGDVVAIGAPGDDDNGTQAGAVYLFERDDLAESWALVDKLLPLDGMWQDQFGSAVSLDGGRVAAGSPVSGFSDPRRSSVSVFEAVLVEPQLEVLGACPGEIEVVISGTTPRSASRLYTSSELGTSIFEDEPCSGTALGLNTPTALDVGTMGFDPIRTLLRVVEASDCGTYLQVVDLKTCLTSEVTQIP